jgi:hypothetical protein
MVFRTLGVSANPGLEIEDSFYHYSVQEQNSAATSTVKSFWCSTPEQNPLGADPFSLFTYYCSLLYRFMYLVSELLAWGS